MPRAKRLPDYGPRTRRQPQTAAQRPPSAPPRLCGRPAFLGALVPWWFNPVLNCGFRIEVTARPAVAPYRWEITGRNARGTLRRGGALFWSADFQSAAGAESMARRMRPPIGRRAWKPALPGKGALRAAPALGSSLCVLVPWRETTFHCGLKSFTAAAAPRVRSRLPFKIQHSTSLVSGSTGEPRSQLIVNEAHRRKIGCEGFEARPPVWGDLGS